ncbi:hypothetical protein [Pseudoalteromonas gelatinilytica]
MISYKDIKLNLNVSDSLALLIATVAFITIQNNVYSFFDYDGYQMYIEANGLAMVRFSKEIISASIMDILSKLKLSAWHYYFICNLSFIASSYIVTRKAGNLKNLIFLLLVINPITFIMYLTPRQTMSIAFSLLAFSTNRFYLKIAIFIFATLTHTASGIISLIFFFIFNSTFKFSLMFMLGFFAIFSMVMSGIIPTKYAYVYTEEISNDRGWGRLMYFLIFTSFLMFLNKSKECGIAFLSALLIIGLHIIAPVGGRLLYIVLPLLLLSYKNLYYTLNYVIFLFFVVINIILCSFIVYSGSYGY